MEAKTPMAYIRNAMTGLGSFIPDWKELSTEEKASLVADARAEMTVLGIPIKEPMLLK